MAQSGCKGVFLGIESDSPHILTLMTKAATIEKYADGMKLLREHDIRLLKEKEQGSKGTSSDSPPRDYAKGYLLGDLRKFSGWHEAKIVPAKEHGNSHELSDSDVVFLHQDFTVTQLIWPGENVIFNQDTPQWRDFCSQQQFKVPDDFDLIASNSAGRPYDCAQI